MFKIIIYLMGISSALAIKCHVCANAHNPECYALENKMLFLRECGKNETFCVLKLDIKYPGLLRRHCAKADFKCIDITTCKTCSTDGCNEGNKIEQKEIWKPDVDEVSELLKANMFSLAAVVLLVIVISIWFVIQCKTKKDVEYTDYDNDGEVIDDEFEEYENKV